MCFFPLSLLPKGVSDLKAPAVVLQQQAAAAAALPTPAEPSALFFLSFRVVSFSCLSPLVSSFWLRVLNKPENLSNLLPAAARVPICEGQTAEPITNGRNRWQRQSAPGVRAVHHNGA